LSLHATCVNAPGVPVQTDRIVSSRLVRVSAVTGVVLVGVKVYQTLLALPRLAAPAGAHDGTGSAVSVVAKTVLTVSLNTGLGEIGAAFLELTKSSLAGAALAKSSLNVRVLSVPPAPLGVASVTIKK